MQTVSSKIRNIHWSAQVAVPLLVVATYSVAFRYLVRELRSLPFGVNQHFVQSLWPTLLVCAGVAGVMALLARQKIVYSAQLQPVQVSDIVLLALPLTPVVQYLLNNPGLLTFWQAAYLLAVFALLSALLVLAVPWMLRSVADVRSVRVLGLVFAFLITNMASLSASFNWYERGDLRVLFGIGLALVALIGFLYSSKHRPLLFVLILAFFASNSALQIGGSPAAQNAEMSTHPFLGEALPTTQPSTPNVYLLVYDSYVANETMLQYGIDNRAQEVYLQQQGFTLYPHTYSIGSYSVASMTPVLNASTEFYGPSRVGTSGAGVVHQVFQQLGYTTYGFFPSDFFFQEVGSSYDVSFPEKRPEAVVMLDSILLGEFRFDIGFDQLTANEFVQRKLQLFNNVPASPALLYAHSFSPGHSQNSGSCLPDEREQFAARLQLANQEMKLDLDTLIANDPDAIIIVAGDHGPYLSKNCYNTSEGGYTIHDITRFDVQDRFGTFLAIRWPGAQDLAAHDDIVVLQDVFPAVLAYLYQDASLLEYRVPPVTLYEPSIVSGVVVEDGIIRGGVNDGEPLFLSGD